MVYFPLSVGATSGRTAPLPSGAFPEAARGTIWRRSGSEEPHRRALRDQIRPERGASWPRADAVRARTRSSRLLSFTRRHFELSVGVEKES